MTENDRHEEAFHEIAECICSKPKGMNHSECFSAQSRKNPLCRDYGKCRLHEKSLEQFEYVLNSRTGDSFLRACPGAGKTEVVGMQAAYEIRQWESHHTGIAVLTFTNSATDVIRERVEQFVGNSGYPHYIGTFASWMHGYIANPFAHLRTGYKGKGGDCSLRIVDEQERDRWLTNYDRGQREKGVQRTPIYPNAFFFDLEAGKWCKKTKNSLKLIEGAKEAREHRKTKKAFSEAGFVNHQDVEYLSVRVLEKHETICSLLSERFPVIIVDECQDLSFIELKILELLKRVGSRIHLIGDVNQSIYRFKKVNPKNVEIFVKTNGLQEYPLLKNFRSIQPIVDICGKLVSHKNVKGIFYDDNNPSCLYFLYSKKDMAELAERFKNLLESRRIPTAHAVIIARGHSTVNKLRPAASKTPDNHHLCLATAIHLWKESNTQNLEEALSSMGKFIAKKFFPKERSDSRYQYCPYSIESHIEWRRWVSRVLDGCLRNGNIANLKQTWTMWAGAVKTDLEQIIIDACEHELPKERDAFNFTAKKGSAKQDVMDTLQTVGKKRVDDIRITTIHQVKGETFDAVLLVSSPTKAGDGGHCSHWLDKNSGDGEHARFAYVASSRPRNLLVWAIPDNDESLPGEFDALGFVGSDSAVQTSDIVYTID